ncbi:Arginine decarboxylase [Candidatus Methylobacter favarea]|uniref:Arginine decarboxylase n=1 Tax=Candidatus Methylobacter favarea TaxID=2707345 RepID=A0A8S0WD83_9GAMM|nr:DUF4266 domain-containing protein [Candidatus Methylobacter favarea]CAA9893065.1 Arginine decarboxylase [Candidatus Methylobacter favarea]
MKRSQLAPAAACLIFGACLSGCAPVAPWERGNLAKPQMALDVNPMLSTLRSHNYSSREAASGGSSAAGGGCGCY